MYTHKGELKNANTDTLIVENDCGQYILTNQAHRFSKQCVCEVRSPHPPPANIRLA